MATIELNVNGVKHDLEIDPNTPLLWVLRDSLGLTGTKYGCGIAECGACTVHVDGEAIRSCVTPVSSVVGKKVVTIEGLSGNELSPLQAIWLEEDVAQCGYCQPGQIMTASALLKATPAPTDKQILDAMSGNLCRCGSHPRIIRAVKRAAEEGSVK